MGRKSRAKRERRTQVDFVAGLTASEGTWLEQPPSADEQARIKAAQKTLEHFRNEAAKLSADEEQLQRFSLEIFRDPRFAPLYFDDWVVEQIIERFGEPPVTEDPADTSFTEYLRGAVQWVATSQVRRAISGQAQRFLPGYVDAGQIEAALAIQYNTYISVMSDANSPLLVQMLVGGLSRWYDEHEEDEAADQPATTSNA